MFFDNPDLTITDSDKTQVDALSQDSTIEYPVYYWVKYHSGNTIITKPENTPTHNFGDFLKALESLKYSASMSTLALAVSNLVIKKLDMEIKTVMSQHASVELNLLEKKCAILKSELPNKQDLVSEVESLLARAQENVSTYKTACETKMTRIKEIMPDPVSQSAPVAMSQAM